MSGWAAAIGGGLNLLGIGLSSRRQRKDAAAARALSDRQFNISNYLSAANYADELNVLLGANSAYATEARHGSGKPGIYLQGELKEKGLDRIGRDRDLFDTRERARIAVNANRLNARAVLGEQFRSAKNHGLTPQEALGLSPPGTSGATPASGGGAALGQSGAAAAATAAQSRERAADRHTSVQIEALRAQTAVRTAQIGAQASVIGSGLASATQSRGQDIASDTSKRNVDVQTTAQLKAAVISGKASNISASISAAPAAARVEVQNWLDQARESLTYSENNRLQQQTTLEQRQSLEAVGHLYQSRQINRSQAVSAAASILFDAGVKGAVSLSRSIFSGVR